MAMPKVDVFKMQIASLESQVATLTNEVAMLKEKVVTGGLQSEPAVDWVDEIWGSFADCPDYDEAMRLGREYRESLRPKPSRRQSGKAARKPVKSKSR